jgi:hypothetical protein
MRALSKTHAFIVSFAVAGTAVSAAFAETQRERNHPRRDQSMTGLQTRTTESTVN